MVAADLNGDGTTDLATANGGRNDVSILIGMGDGSFVAPAPAYPVGANPNSLAAADFNDDSRTDLVTANNFGDTVSVLLNNGDGTFGTPLAYQVSNRPESVAAADLNGDGRIDLATVSGSTSRVSVLLGNGDGTFFSVGQYAVADGGHSVTAADLNGDRRLDLATANNASDSVSVLIGAGDGTFFPAAAYTVGTDTDPHSLASGDVNGDGTMDLITANLSSDNVSVLVGRGDGTFATPAPAFPVGPHPRSVAAADVNGDGTIDVVTANEWGPSVSVLIGAGDGTFATPAPAFPVGTSPRSVAAADVNGDGRIDLAAANYGDGSVSVLLNTTGQSDTTPPVIAPHDPVFAQATSADGVIVTFETPTATDPGGVPGPVTCSPASGSLFPLGTTTVTCSSTDAHGNTGIGTFPVTVTYGWSGVQQPINADGTSIFKAGSTVPVRFSLTGASAGTTNAVATLSYTKLTNSVAGAELEAASTSAATTGNQFRYDATSGQYIYNWSTKELTSGTYRLILDLGDGVSRSVVVSLK